MLNGTYDQHILSGYATAMIAQLAATLGSAMERITIAEVNEKMKDAGFRHLVETMANVKSTSPVNEAKEQMYNEIVHAKFRRNFSVRSDRDNEH
ncbi:hypothetical protein LTR56_025367 [Elasticomyces elasticus]|nr:hypothetical protein LTR56_025367 [Elasticomyces elasticus]KAK3655278.1 hypothetical protein LTR22_010308 [Elasticomyces elasticus]KAK5748833.1 hypothetical protein LTS12_021130 [Elasticomyces elasticus]